MSYKERATFLLEIKYSKLLSGIDMDLPPSLANDWNQKKELQVYKKMSK